MKHGRKFGTISISLEMSLKNVEGFKKFEGENFLNKIKVHPPPGKPEGCYPIFFRNFFVKINTMKKYSLRIGNLVINWFKMDRLGMNQNISVKRKSLQWMLRNPMKI